MVSPDGSANGNMGQDKDDVTTDPTLLLAKVSNGGQASMLGNSYTNLFLNRNVFMCGVLLLCSVANNIA